MMCLALMHLLFVSTRQWPLEEPHPLMNNQVERLTTPCLCAKPCGLRFCAPGCPGARLPSSRAMLSVQLRMYSPTCSSILSRSASLHLPARWGIHCLQHLGLYECQKGIHAVIKDASNPSNGVCMQAAMPVTARWHCSQSSASGIG